MATAKLTAIIQRYFLKAVKDPDEYVMYAVDPDNNKIWYALIRNVNGPNDEFKGGQYMFRIEISDKFPFEPPRFYALTPNGFYNTNNICCISQGEYHKHEYKAVLGIDGFIKELWNGLMNYHEMGSGINLITTTQADKKRLAAESHAYNQKYLSKEFKLIIDSFSEYSKKWPALPPHLTVESLFPAAVSSSSSSA